MTRSFRKFGTGFAALLGMAGCSYTSEYRPPQDGRARPVWDGDKIAVYAPSKLPRCTQGPELKRSPPPGAFKVPQDRNGYYRPRGHVSVSVVVIGPPPPMILLPPLVPIVPGAAGPGDVDMPAELAVILAVGAVVAFPFIALGLAMGHPEPEEEVASAIDRVNRYNDRAREHEAYCYAIAAPAEATP